MSKKEKKVLKQMEISNVDSIKNLVFSKKSKEKQKFIKDIEFITQIKTRISSNEEDSASKSTSDKELQ